MIEIYAAILGACIGVGGTGAVMTLSGFANRTSKSREAVIELTAAVKSIAGKLEELHIDMRTDRAAIYGRLDEHGNRLTRLEASQN